MQWLSDISKNLINVTNILQTHLARDSVHRVYQHCYIFRRRVLADAVTQVENMGGTRARGVGMRGTKAVQDLGDLGLDGSRWCKQHIRVDIAL